ncbi:hypothetical protein FRC15_003849 [Serendipita sp. 397]|nr:hypothetical protein FRC15_003849 [Serendipita sp. 397]KAG8837200.1 hypothetical protein FRC18_009826 [Serendipita sp. 400]
MSQSVPTSPTTPVHPFANTKSLLTVIRDDHVDMEAETEFLAGFEDDDTVDSRSIPPSVVSVDARSVISHEIWLDDQTSGVASRTFARNAVITGFAAKPLSCTTFTHEIAAGLVSETIELVPTLVSSRDRRPVETK